jgi:cyclohexa-1,5-dienecarbonyl-CoA hydratase
VSSAAATAYGDDGPRTIEARLEADGTVLLLTLNQPKGNVLTMEMVGELGDALEAHREVAGLRLVVLRGAGGHFSFGASVEEHRKDQAPAMLATFHRFIRKLAAYPVPTAALVEGSCLGGGFEVALTCHFLFANPGARFGCPEIQLGVFPPVLAAAGARRFGGLVSERLILTGETLGAEEADRLGFLTGLFAAGEDPWEGLLAWYGKRLRPLSAFTLRQATEAARAASGWLGELDRALDAAEKLYVERLLPSHDGNEGIEAFLAKRRPVWQDR